MLTHCSGWYCLVDHVAGKWYGGILSDSWWYTHNTLHNICNLDTLWPCDEFEGLAMMTDLTLK